MIDPSMDNDERATADQDERADRDAEAEMRRQREALRERVMADDAEAERSVLNAADQLDAAESNLRQIEASMAKRLADMRFNRDQLNAEIKRTVETHDLVARALAVFERARAKRNDDGSDS